MKGFNKFLAVIFSIMIVFVCIICILYVGDILEKENIVNTLDMLVATRESKLATIISAAFVGLIAIIFAITTDSASSNGGASLTLPLTTGNISITCQTFETMVLNVVKKYNNLKNVKAKVDIREDGLYIELFVYILEGTVVSDIMCKIQEDIKTSILKQTTVEVKKVEVKVKGIYSLNENKFQD